MATAQDKSAADRLPAALFGGLGLVGLALVVLATPTMLLLMAGLCPTLFVALADRRPGRLRSHAMAVMNLAGLAPWLVQLWHRGGSFEAARGILEDPLALLSIYGAAAGALVLLWVGPWLAASALTLSRRHLGAELERAQRGLEKEWGREVGQPDKPVG